MHRPGGDNYEPKGITNVLSRKGNVLQKGNLWRKIGEMSHEKLYLCGS